MAIRPLRSLAPRFKQDLFFSGPEKKMFISGLESSSQFPTDLFMRAEKRQLRKVYDFRFRSCENSCLNFIHFPRVRRHVESWLKPFWVLVLIFSTNLFKSRTITKIGMGEN